MREAAGGGGGGDPGNSRRGRLRSSAKYGELGHAPRPCST